MYKAINLSGAECPVPNTKIVTATQTKLTIPRIKKSVPFVFKNCIIVCFYALPPLISHNCNLRFLGFLKFTHFIILKDKKQALENRGQVAQSRFIFLVR